MMQLIFKTLARRAIALVPERDTVRDLGSFRMKLLTSHNLDMKVRLGRYEPETIMALKRRVKPGDVAVDVGANIGFISLTLASIVGPTGHVYSFEPSDWTFDRLQANLDLNDFKWITARRAAVADADQVVVQMTLPRGYRLDGKFTHSDQSVAVVRLDTALAHLERLDLLKTDTDGHEPEVIAGAMKLIERFKPTLLIEVVSDYAAGKKEDLEGMFKMLKGIGYRFETDAGRSLNDPLQLAGNLRIHESYNVIGVAS